MKFKDRNGATWYPSKDIKINWEPLCKEVKMDKIEEVLTILVLVASKQVQWCTDTIRAYQQPLSRTDFREFAYQICQLFESKPPKPDK